MTCNALVDEDLRPVTGSHEERAAVYEKLLEKNRWQFEICPTWFAHIGLTMTGRMRTHI